MKYSTLIFIGLTILSIILLILGLIFEELFTVIPLLFIFPLSCGFKRRFEGYSPEDSQLYENSEENALGQNVEENFEINGDKSYIYIRKCPECNNQVSEQNLKFCPHCGAKLQTSKG